MIDLTKRFGDVPQEYLGDYSKEKIFELHQAGNNDLEVSVAIKSKLKDQNCTEIEAYLPILLNLLKSQVEQAKYESVLSLIFICIKFPSKVSYSQILTEIHAQVLPCCESEYKELRHEIYKLLSILFEKKNSHQYLPFFDAFENYLAMHIDEVAMDYILEIFIGMFETLPDNFIEKILVQVSDIAGKAIEKDLIEYSLVLLNKIIDCKLGKFLEKVVNAKAGQSMIRLLSNPKYFDDSLKVLQKLAKSAQMIPVFKEAISYLIEFLYNQPIEIKHFASEMLLYQANSGFEYLENMINKNFIPTLVTFLTSDNAKIKKDMILIVKAFFRQQLQHQIIELLENNTVNILCRIIERDNNNRNDAIECMEYLLNGGNEIFKSFADSCRFSRLLTQIGGDQDCNEIVARVLRRHYPKAPIPQVKNNPNNFANPFANNFGAVSAGPIFGNQSMNSANLVQNTATNLLGINNNIGNQGNLGNLTAINMNQNLALPNTQRKNKKNEKKEIKKKVNNKKHVTKPDIKVFKQAKLNFKGKTLANNKKGLRKPNDISIFPASRLYKKFKSTRLRVSKNSAVYMGGVLTYLCSEFLLNAVNVSINLKKKIITPRTIYLSLQIDSEIKELMKNIILPETGHCNFDDFN